ncbi:MAG: signal peptidase I [Clostridia bacterium]|nr:signal peptidase I [Clostridia bacterium]
MNQSQPTSASATKERRPFVNGLFDIFEMFAISLFAVFMIFTFGVRLCEVEGTSMYATLSGGESLLVNSIGYTPEQDDIVVFHLTDPSTDMQKTLVKRVIATGGQKLVINFTTRVITVDGKIYKDANAQFFNTKGQLINQYLNDAIPAAHPNYAYVDNCEILEMTIPEGMLFVMGDNRNFSNDSRNPDIGCIDERCVLGKVVVRLSPFTVFH